PWKSFCDLSCAFIELILHLLGLERSMDRTSALGITGESTGLVLAMCKATGADTYLSGVHGRDYLDPAEFERQGIRLRFQEFSCPAYSQCWPGPFVADLSIIDLLFNCGPDSLKVIAGDRAA
ncbi:MAG TPA: WbqC family protein, partial [Planctomycetota bacterium]|nr:WbqC family protein [Planctomycetota bacterium]